MPVFDWECVVVPPVLVNWIYGPVGTLGDHQHVAGSLVVICWVKLYPTVEPGDGELIVIVGGYVSLSHHHQALLSVQALPSRLPPMSQQHAGGLLVFQQVRISSLPAPAEQQHTPNRKQALQTELTHFITDAQMLQEILNFHQHIRLR